MRVLWFVRAAALSHTLEEKKDGWGVNGGVGVGGLVDGVCEVAKEGERSDGVLDGGRAGGDECVLTV